jgi:hypothetical protein
LPDQTDPSKLLVNLTFNFSTGKGWPRLLWQIAKVSKFEERYPSLAANWWKQRQVPRILVVESLTRRVQRPKQMEQAHIQLEVPEWTEPSSDVVIKHGCKCRRSPARWCRPHEPIPKRAVFDWHLNCGFNNLFSL